MKHIVSHKALIVSAIVVFVPLLAGCPATLQTVKVPVPVECRQTVPMRPVMPTELLALDVLVDRLVQALLAEIERREGYELELRAALVACTTPIAPTD